MERIDILSTKKEAITEYPLKLRQGKVCRIRLHRLVPLPALRIELPHQRRVSRECLRRGHVLHTVPAPQSVCAPKGRQTAFGTYAGSRQNE